MMRDSQALKRQPSDVCTLNELMTIQKVIVNCHSWNFFVCSVRITKWHKRNRTQASQKLSSQSPDLFLCSSLCQKHVAAFAVREIDGINESEKQKHQSEKLLRRHFYILVHK